MIKAVIFDMDGLMFDTEVMFKNKFRVLLDEMGVGAPDSVIASLIGRDSKYVNILEKDYPGIVKAMDRFHEEKASYFFEYFKEPGSANKKGLRELVEYLDENDIPYAIASSSFSHHIRLYLSHAGFDIKPKAIVSSKDGYPSKPEPGIFLSAGEMLGYSGEQCLILEDSKNGIIAAARAKMDYIFVRDQVVPDEEMKSYIKKECKDLIEVRDYIIESRKAIE